MATKTKKEKEVIDFTKPEKIEAEDLKKLQMTVRTIDRLTADVGRMETQKYALLVAMQDGQQTINKLRIEFKEKYGSDNINIQTGEIAIQKKLLVQNKMAKLIRKISIGKDYKNDAMHYAVGQEVYGGHTICDIIEEDDKYSVYIRKNKDVLPWKDFNKNMAVSVEYNLEY